MDGQGDSSIPPLTSLRGGGGGGGGGYNYLDTLLYASNVVFYV